MKILLVLLSLTMLASCETRDLEVDQLRSQVTDQAQWYSQALMSMRLEMSELRGEIAAIRTPKKMIKRTILVEQGSIADMSTKQWVECTQCQGK